ncbi:hypothetical protein BSLG_003102 [Batrachochytrium salamandrivorans]|nr:hypothetical protein BASA62_000008 [Batrachochytrium salamandrivorans]KAH6560294.1 hypothetical protein BASA60_000007 [Batrachochytrium salamandrivorans]KAH9246259.1 hypothetical protein BASA81_016214 [Batrachochytrium salamandrivorans]KAH9264885.1 hypothetical protein BASA83_011632 [Batrachochytrium salamandrivorans]KAJ1342343.1 hypothetical protein BSLG_003102 [Batrachochytrium salamandrivorans]
MKLFHYTALLACVSSICVDACHPGLNTDEPDSKNTNNNSQQSHQPILSLQQTDTVNPSSPGFVVPSSSFVEEPNESQSPIFTSIPLDVQDAPSILESFIHLSNNNVDSVNIHWMDTDSNLGQVDSPDQSTHLIQKRGIFSKSKESLIKFCYKAQEFIKWAELLNPNDDDIAKSAKAVGKAVGNSIKGPMILFTAKLLEYVRMAKPLFSLIIIYMKTLKKHVTEDRFNGIGPKVNKHVRSIIDTTGVLAKSVHGFTLGAKRTGADFVHLMRKLKDAIDIYNDQFKDNIKWLKLNLGDKRDDLLKMYESARSRLDELSGFLSGIGNDASKLLYKLKNLPRTAKAPIKPKMMNRIRKLLRMKAPVEQDAADEKDMAHLFTRL